jgi:hypothetical protein
MTQALPSREIVGQLVSGSRRARLGSLLLSVRPGIVLLKFLPVLAIKDHFFSSFANVVPNFQKSAGGLLGSSGFSALCKRV